MSELLNQHGEKVSEKYSTILTDPDFERKLKAFDPNLKLLFDHEKKRWVVLEWAHDHSGWNIIIVAQDDDGNPIPLGEWVFNRLWVFRKRWEQKMSMGVDRWFNDLRAKAEEETEIIEEKAHDDVQAGLREDITQWRKGAKEIQNLPVSDATAGYRKI